MIENSPPEPKIPAMEASSSGIVGKMYDGVPTAARVHAPSTITTDSGIANRSPSEPNDSVDHPSVELVVLSVLIGTRRQYYSTYIHNLAE